MPIEFSPLALVAAVKGSVISRSAMQVAACRVGANWLLSLSLAIPLYKNVLNVHGQRVGKIFLHLITQRFVSYCTVFSEGVQGKKPAEKMLSVSPGLGPATMRLSSGFTTKPLSPSRRTAYKA